MLYTTGITTMLLASLGMITAVIAIQILPEMPSPLAREVSSSAAAATPTCIPYQTFKDPAQTNCADLIGNFTLMFPFTLMAGKSWSTWRFNCRVEIHAINEIVVRTQEGMGLADLHDACTKNGQIGYIADENSVVYLGSYV